MKRFWNRVTSNPYWKMALYVPVYLLAFFVIERLLPDRGFFVSHIPLDDVIPFRAGFVYFYVLWFPYLVAPGVFWLLEEPETFRRYMLSFMLGFSFVVAVCAAFPNCQTMRPDPVPGDGVASALVRLLYWSDTPTNVLPSGHVIGAASVVFACRYSPAARKTRWVSPLCLLLAVLITASTMFIKQHSALDVLAALAMCPPLYLAVYGRRGIPARRGAKAPGKRN